MQVGMYALFVGEVYAWFCVGGPWPQHLQAAAAGLAPQTPSNVCCAGEVVGRGFTLGGYDI